MGWAAVRGKRVHAPAPDLESGVGGEWLPRGRREAKSVPKL
jgi:hypothetical protein